ncbi:MAG: hypothetical protein K6V36_06200 [Anaerolineae bacterium]|nr:hypothetical protein [Anaerolineae bacterium]
MRDSWQILADLFDAVIQRERGRIPPEVNELFDLGLRLHAECPDINPAFMQTLQRRLESEWRAREHAPGRAAREPIRLVPMPCLRRAAVAFAVAIVLLIGVAIPSPLRSRVRASLLDIAATLGVRVEQERRVAVPGTPPAEHVHCFHTLEQAQRGVSFRVRAPASLPADIRFSRACLVKAGEMLRLHLYYEFADSDLAGGPQARRGTALSIQEYPTPDQGAFSVAIGPESAERIQIAGRSALLVSGAWGKTGFWSRAAPKGTLLIQDGDLVISIGYNCTQAEALSIAESLFE